MDKKIYESTRFICSLINEGALAASTKDYPPLECIEQCVKNIIAEAIERNASAAYYVDPEIIAEHIMTIYRLCH